MSADAPDEIVETVEALSGEVVSERGPRSRGEDSAREPSTALAPLPARMGGGWACAQLRLEGDDALVVRFQRETGGDWIEVTAVPATAPGPAFHRMERAAVRYRGRVQDASDERRQEVRALVLGVCAAIDARLAASPGRSLAAALGRSREGGRMVFSRETLRALLAPDIVEGRPGADGWTLLDVYPTSYQRPGSGDLLELVLDFRRGEGDLTRMLFVVSPRALGKPGFAQSEHFSLGFLSLGAAAPRGTETLRALLSFVFQLRDHEGLEVVFPTVDDDVAPARLPAPKGEPAAASATTAASINLAINADCAQQCGFCSIKDTAPPDPDGADTQHAQFEADLAASRQRGTRTVRFNGYDPLAYPRVLELARFATRLGYDRAEVFSPSTRLADRAFCRELCDALPADKRFYVPLYAADAPTHDRVVGVPGSHARVLRALANLRELVGPECVTVLFVATKQNLAAIPALIAFARAQGFAYSGHLPYPSFESRADRYFDVAARQTDVVEAEAPAYAPDGALGEHRGGGVIPVLGVAPCVNLRVLSARGVRVKRWLRVSSQTLLPGTEYRDPSIRHGAEQRAQSAFAAATVTCPHAGSCVLLEACGGEVLRAYVDLHGLEEFRAVGLAELIEAM